MKTFFGIFCSQMTFKASIALHKVCYNFVSQWKVSVFSMRGKYENVVKGRFEKFVYVVCDFIQNTINNVNFGGFWVSKFVKNFWHNL